MSRISVRGWLLSDSGLAIPNRLVEAYVSGTTTPAATTSTDGNGQWAFASLSEATYDVKQEALGRARWLRGGRQEQVSELQVVDLLNLGAVASVSGLGAAHLPAHTHAGAGQGGTVDYSVITNTPPSGAYTPTLTNGANLDSSTASECHWLRMGNRVVVGGYVQVDPTTTGLDTQLGISLPVASDFAAATDCGGAAASPGSQSESAGIYADATNNRALMQWKCIGTAALYMCFTFVYTVK